MDSVDFDRRVSIYEKGVWWKKRLHVKVCVAFVFLQAAQ